MLLLLKYYLICIILTFFRLILNIFILINKKQVDIGLVSMNKNLKKVWFALRTKTVYIGLTLKSKRRHRIDCMRVKKVNTGLVYMSVKIIPKNQTSLVHMKVKKVYVGLVYMRFKKVVICLACIRVKKTDMSLVCTKDNKLDISTKNKWPLFFMGLYLFAQGCIYHILDCSRQGKLKH